MRNSINGKSMKTATLTDVITRAHLGVMKLPDTQAPPREAEQEIAIDYPRISAQPEYAVEQEKLNRFSAQRDQAIKTRDALQAEFSQRYVAKADTEDDAIAKVEHLLSGDLPRDIEAEIRAAAKLIDALGAAITAQHIVLRRVDQTLSRAAGRRYSEEHKERVRRVMAAVVELHEANQAEGNLRRDLGRLGYNGDTVPAMPLNTADNPFAVCENVTYYWYEDARLYVRTDAQVAAAVRKGKLAALVD